jgi:hypothetical protein
MVFGEHSIRKHAEFERHVDYIHFAERGGNLGEVKDGFGEQSIRAADRVRKIASAVFACGEIFARDFAYPTTHPTRPVIERAVSLPGNTTMSNARSSTRR